MVSAIPNPTMVSLTSALPNLYNGLLNWTTSVLSDGLLALKFVLLWISVPSLQSATGEVVGTQENGSQRTVSKNLWNGLDYKCVRYAYVSVDRSN